MFVNCIIQNNSSVGQCGFGFSYNDGFNYIHESILDDISNGLKPEATAVPSFEPVKSIKEYSSYLEELSSNLLINTTSS